MLYVPVMVSVDKRGVHDLLLPGISSRRFRGVSMAELLDDVERGDDEGPGLRSITQLVRDDVFGALGVPLPPAVVRINETLPDNRVVLTLFEVPYRAMEVEPEMSRAEKLETIREFLGERLQDRASDFLGIGETKLLLD